MYSLYSLLNIICVLLWFRICVNLKLSKAVVLCKLDSFSLSVLVTLSSEGSTLRAWNLPDGLLNWETVLQVSTPSKPLLYVSVSNDFFNRLFVLLQVIFSSYLLYLSYSIIHGFV